MTWKTESREAIRAVDEQIAGLFVERMEAARDICQAVEASLPAPTVIRSRNGFIAYKKPVMKQLEAIAKKHDVDIDLTDEYNITMGYLTEWLYAKYSRGLIDNDDDLIG